MSRSSLRLKQYRPMSADFAKKPLSSVFGMNGDSGDKTSDSNDGVLLINCKSFSHFYEFRVKHLLFFNVNSQISNFYVQRQCCSLPPAKQYHVCSVL